jgi:hypothetical protein
VEVTPEFNRFGSGGRGDNNEEQVGSRNVISRFGSAQNALRRRLKKPRERVAAPSFEAGNAGRIRRSPELVSIVFPSPALNNLIPDDDVIIPILPQTPTVAYVYPESRALTRENRQTKAPEQQETTTPPPVEEEEYEDWLTDVSVSQSVSESFSVSKIISNLVNFVSSTFAPPTTTTTTTTTTTITTITTIEQEKDEETTTATTEIIETTTATAGKPKQTNHHNKLHSLFKPNKRVHPFLGSKSTESISTTETTTSTRRSFLPKKTLPSLAEASRKDVVGTEATEEDGVDMKLMKMMNILNNRDAKEEMKEENDEAEKPRSSDEFSKENEIEAGEKSTIEKIDILLANRNVRPKFHVPKTLQARLLEQVVPVETKNETANSTTDSPVLKLFRKPSSPLRPSFKARPSIISRPIELPKTSLVRPDRPLDLAVAPSSISRSRFNTRRPVVGSEPAHTVVSTVTITTTTAPATEKLTVGEILAGLHGDAHFAQEQQKTSTLRPHSFKPKLSTRSRSKLRANVRQHSGDDADGFVVDLEEDKNVIGDHEVPEAKNEEAEKEEIQVTDEQQPPRPSGRRRIVPASRSQQQLPSTNIRAKPSAPRPRRPVSRKSIATPTRASLVPAVKPSRPSAGERVLSGDDLMASLGLGSAAENTQEALVVVTPTASVESSQSILESLFGGHNAEEEGKKQPKTAITAGLDGPTVEDILRFAVVDSIQLPPGFQAQPVIQSQPEPATRRPLAPQGASVQRGRSRSRARVPGNRFAPAAKPVVTEAPVTRSAVINNRNLRVRQRGRTLVSQTQRDDDDDDDDDDTSTETVIPSTRSSSRFINRVRRPINRIPASSTTSSVPSTAITEQVNQRPASFGTRNSNLRTSARVNNRVRVRGGASRVRVRPSEVKSEEQNAQELRNESPVSTATESSSLGKSEESEVVNPPTNNTPEEKESEESVTLRTGTFQPKFGARQRDFLRNRLQAQLFDDETAPLVSTATTPSTTSSFKTVSPSIGLSAVPASFFTTTPRFIQSFSPTPAPISLEGFLPTLSPLQRVGRSTVGYAVPATEKPRFSLNKLRGSRPKFGEKETTAKPADDNEEDGEMQTTFGISTTQIPTTVGSSTHDVSTEARTAPPVVTKAIKLPELKTADVESSSEEESPLVVTGQEEEGLKIGQSLFRRPRIDFLKKLDKKNNEQQEKALLDSFGGVENSEKTRPRPRPSPFGGKKPNTGNRNNKPVESYKRPRRRFNLGLKDLNIPKEEEEDENDVKETTPPKVAENITTTEATLKTESPAEKKSFAPLKPPRFSLPKGFKIPFNTNRFGANQPKLLSFQIIKPKKKSVKEETTTTTQASIEIESEEVETTTSIPIFDAKLALKQKLKFGRKTFGSLLRPKMSLLPPPSSTQTPDPTPDAFQPTPRTQVAHIDEKPHNLKQS